VFDASVVRRFDIAISASDLQATYDDVADIARNAKGDLDALPMPIWIPATVTYSSKTWTQVGFRWKGHASLTGAYNQQIRKLSFDLAFDHFESSFPELDNQRFYGFKSLAFGNAYKDPSLMRDKTAADIFRAAGVPAARSSFAAVYFDTGDGPVYRGLYTIIESPGDRMLEVQIGDGTGNLYKPWGMAGKWLSVAELGEADIEAHFEKQTNEDTSDWSDAFRVLNALHADRTDTAAWRSGLEAVFDVPAFLKVLAVSQSMVNWDSYGCMHHNHLVYANPLNGGRFLWMPWDLNESMEMTTRTGCPAPGSVMFDEIVKDTDSTVDTDWPLIRFILGDDTYRAAYVKDLRDVLDGAFAAEPLIAQMEADHALIAPYVVGPIATEGAASVKFTCLQATSTQTIAEIFENSVTYTETTSADGGTSDTTDDSLTTHVRERHAAVEAVLAAQ
jgi:hypothetical protein